MVIAPIGVYVLAQQVDLFDAAVGEAGDLCNDIIDRARYFLASRVGHNAESAVFAATFHDGDKGRGSVYAGLGKPVKFFDLGKAHVDDHRLPTTTVIDHLGQSMQCLRAKYQVDVRSAFANFRTFLTGNATAHPDNQVRISLLQMLPASQLVEDLLLCFLSD